MDIIGKWKVKELGVLDENMDNLVWKTVDEIMSDENIDESDYSTFIDGVMQFTEDGTFETLLPVPPDLPQSEIDEAIAQGMAIRDGYAVLESKEWKAENGKNMLNTDTEGELLGEKVSPWVEIHELGDMIEISLLGLVKMRLARVN
ncbi:MAG: hypothetical protein PHR20_08210 [Bacteroidales bacterium]|nr:hypothetical protein [Bacteroidales bacterium]